MGMIGTASGQFGTQAGGSVVMTGSTHPLAAGLTGTVTVTSSSDTSSWGIVNSNAFKIATIPGASSKAAIFAYEPGVAMPGLVAPARRVGFFLADQTASLLTASGWKLFDAAVRWAAAAFPQPVTTEKAVMLVDGRLYGRLAPRIDQYRQAAQLRRGFGIALHVIDGIDEWPYVLVRSYLQQQRAGAPGLEGVVVMGNIKLPSFATSSRARGRGPPAAVKELYQQAGTDAGSFRELGMEMLVGDPFMDLNH
jgi:hypothetical protein